MQFPCPKAPDGIHGLVGGVRGSDVFCGYCRELDEKETAKAKAWWNSKHEPDCLCSKCIPENKTKEAPYKKRARIISGGKS